MGKPSLNAYVAELAADMDHLQITANRTTNNNHVEDNSSSAELKKAQLCDSHHPFAAVFKQGQGSTRNLHHDFFTILLLTYHMVQWMKVTSTRGQSYQEDEDLY